MSEQNLSQQIAETIYKKITVSGEFAPGMKLPGENELCTLLGVSRSTLREAIRILASQGVLHVYRGKGTYVSEELRPFGEFSLGDLEHTRMRLHDLFEARLIFEPQTAALACRRASDRELEEIIKKGREVEQVIRSGQDRTEADQAFHSAIVAASHNEFLQHLVPLISSAVEEAIAYGGMQGILAEDTLRDHALLIEFLSRRDADGAAQAMAVHLRRSLLSMGLEQFYPEG